MIHDDEEETILLKLLVSFKWLVIYLQLSKNTKSGIQLHDRSPQHFILMMLLHNTQTCLPWDFQEKFTPDLRVITK